MFIPNIDKFRIILASQSPRRQQLLNDAGITFDVVINSSGDENYPKQLVKEQIAVFLAKYKAKSFNGDLKENEILITADTIVWLKNEALNKPVDFNDAVSILQKLSGNCHQVYTGVCIKSIDKEVVFSAGTDVYFKKLSLEEITYYVENYKPYDKAGAYGIQEWIGYIAIEKINGSFFNVMGLPIQKLYHELDKFINT
ncbi:MAG: septum formation protein Maf [Bacteroidetes bacterium GWC2_33_15]|nr:MAG: septum formation protein Maf [Bacteroidetes bacterium GWA2_33_15]OFX50316.1 MAG: septum formation protein Maf [Bacteroidetes bacterium GWC2_33_15]OFX66767.1 MAG: septum formation protein Maf [Bacteroidetes bacterium GWB2_32_14]OFX69385.1 MAG: septum formation protein Maf [Bacteroidetes bacterium GWD2_33_33]HAN18708.1 septum formation protein Maf [Bacteroidales bacterium]